MKPKPDMLDLDPFYISNRKLVNRTLMFLVQNVCYKGTNKQNS